MRYSLILVETRKEGYHAFSFNSSIKPILVLFSKETVNTKALGQVRQKVNKNFFRSIDHYERF